MTSRREGRRRGRWRTISAIWGICSLLASGVVVWTVLRQPAWYAPTPIDESRLRTDKSELSGLLDDIGAALNGGASIDVVLDEGQVNRWITARGEIWPEQQIEIVGLSDPVIQFLPRDRVRVAAMATRGGVRIVLSAIFRLEATPENLRLHLESARAGRLPIPRGSLMRSLERLFTAPEGGGGAVTGETIELRNQWTWPNGKRRFRIERLEIAEGQAQMTLQPVRGLP